MRWHNRFEWDQRKADRNTSKHGITFDQAAEVLLDAYADRFHLEEYDADHSIQEDRFTTTASHPANRDIIIVVSWTQRQDECGLVTRIISARRATLSERNRYESEIA